MTAINRIRRRITGSPGAPADIAHGELAFNEVEQVLYYGNGKIDLSDKAGAALSIAGIGAFVSVTGTQNIGGDKTFTGQIFVPTPPTGDDSTRAANTTWVQVKVIDGGNF